MFEKSDCQLEEGEGRTRVQLTAWRLGGDLLITIYNENVHCGATAVGQLDRESGRVYVSTITLAGHKDDIVAQRAAYAITKQTGKSACVVTGIHLDDITPQEIAALTDNARKVVERFLTEQG